MSAETEKVIKETCDRLKPAEKDKDRHRSRLNDFYQYAMPWRHQIDNTYDEKILDTIFDSTAMDSVSDFAADMLATLTPQHYEWIVPEPSMYLSAKDRQLIQPQIDGLNFAIFSEIRRSNYFSEALECYQDLSHGTMAMVIQDVDISKPVHCEAIPANDLLISRGPYKSIDVRGFEMRIQASHIPEMWPDALKDVELAKIIEDSPAKEIKIIQCAYRDYSNRGTEVWQYRALADKKFLLEKNEYTGQGSCPIQVARWMTDATTCWGIGPGYLKLPDIKTSNLLVEMILERLEDAVDPIYTYEDDGVMNIENAIENGSWIARAQGSDAPEALESNAKFDVAYFNRQELKESIMRGFYQDKPLQRGKTPPTASQFLEEAADSARRLGAPAGRLAVEWLFPVYNRFAYILNKRGKLPKVELNGEAVSLVTNSPLIKEQQMADALNLQRFSALLDSVVGPEMRMAIIDPIEAAMYLKDRMGVKPEIIADLNDLEALIGQIKGQLANAVSAGAAPQEPPV